MEQFITSAGILSIPHALLSFNNFAASKISFWVIL